MEVDKIDKVDKIEKTKTPTPNFIKRNIPVKIRLPSPVPSPTCSGMFD